MFNFVTSIGSNAVCFICKQIRGFNENNIRRYFLSKHSNYATNLSLIKRTKSLEQHFNSVARQNIFYKGVNRQPLMVNFWKSVWIKQVLLQQSSVRKSPSLLQKVAQILVSMASSQMISCFLLPCTKLLCIYICPPRTFSNLDQHITLELSIQHDSQYHCVRQAIWASSKISEHFSMQFLHPGAAARAHASTLSPPLALF